MTATTSDAIRETKKDEVGIRTRVQWLRKGEARWPWFLCVLVIALAGSAGAPAAENHSWQRINYPPISVPGASGDLRFLVDSASYKASSHLRFSIRWGTDRGQPAERPQAAISDAVKISVRLHLSDGRIVLPEAEPNRDWEGISLGLGVQWSLLYYFPWGENKLEEAWIELRLPQQTYWIELPYGFTRDPSGSLLADADHGMPEFPPTMKNLPAKDLLVPWLFVEYDLDASQIQNHWRLSLRVSNPFTARAEVILRREEGRWDLHAPRTAMETQWPGGRSDARCVGIRLTHGFSRSDDFQLGGGPDPEKGRIWGKIVVKVDDQSYECVVPSSLFKYVHGVTDPYHKQRLPRPKPPDGDD